MGMYSSQINLHLRGFNDSISIVFEKVVCGGMYLF